MINELKKLGFKNFLKALYSPKNGIIGFFYINNIVFAYKKGQKGKINSKSRWVEVVFGSSCNLQLNKTNYIIIIKSLYCKNLQEICS